MRKRLRWGLVFLFAILPLFLNGPVHSQSDEVGFYFPETGHWVVGDFLEVYRGASSPSQVYGCPITDAFIDDDNKTVQYFEKARFVLDPNAPPALQVELTQLGKLSYTRGIPLRRPPTLSGCKKFHETGFEVCYDFLEFFKANGDLTQFGYPISNYEIHDDSIVQYFQLARFEWHPELQASQPVKVSNLGSEYFDKMNEDPQLLLPQLGDSITQTTMKINLRAFVGESFVSFEGDQELYVIVLDQNRQPVSGAEVNVTVIYPDGKPTLYPMGDTNVQGVTNAVIEYSTTQPSQIILLVEATYNNLRDTTRTSFQTWH